MNARRAGLPPSSDETFCTIAESTADAIRRVGPVADRHRLTIRSIDPDPRGASIRSASAHLGLSLPDPVEVADVIHVSGALDDDQRTRLAAAVADPLLQHASWDPPQADGIEVTFLPGVTDTSADAVLHATTMALAS